MPRVTAHPWSEHSRRRQFRPRASAHGPTDVRHLAPRRSCCVRGRTGHAAGGDLPESESTGEFTLEALTGPHSRVLEAVAAVADVEVGVGQTDVRLDVRVRVLFDQVRLAAAGEAEIPIVQSARGSWFSCRCTVVTDKSELAAAPDGVRAFADLQSMSPDAGSQLGVGIKLAVGLAEFLLGFPMVESTHSTIFNMPIWVIG